MTRRAENIGITFSQHLALQQKLHPGASGGFTALLQEIMVAAKIISREVRKAGLVDALGLTGKTNVQGEAVQILDDFANTTIIRNVHHTGHLCVMSSEENEEPIPIPDEYPSGPYAMTFDPLDGSSNIDANVSIGSIFSIHRKRSRGEKGTLEDLLQPGAAQAAAGYVIYGSSTILVYVANRQVHGFTLDPTVGEFLLSHPHIRIPESGGIYSVNEGNSHAWEEPTRRIVESLKGTENPRGKPYSGRYVGSLVADFHRTLLYGGIFLYPADAKSRQGKLRLLSEAAPIALIAEGAGGRATTGRGPILDLQPTELHERVPLIVGSPREVAWAESFYRGKGA
ncbi:MAG: class 1 fructose-bisphosphatase [Candidatus Eisenbacteria bacterium]|nr:class 1 fructose-bisphosphatase [Candidatus Eisenbacteria bacterium]